MPLPRKAEVYDEWDEAYEDDYFDARPKANRSRKRRTGQ